MLPLIPFFIHEKYELGQYRGVFRAIALSLDLSGFTSSTEKLMKQGNEGAETLSAILNRLFEPMIGEVHAVNGFITSFAGDSFTALFPVLTTEHAVTVLRSVRQIQRFIKAEEIQQTKFGAFHFSARLGLSVGAVEWGIVGNRFKSYYFRGDAIDGCIGGQTLARNGELVIDQQFFSHVENLSLETEPRSGHHFSVLSGGDDSVPSDEEIPRDGGATKNWQPEIVGHFVPRDVLTFAGSAEFRDVVSVFISFSSTADHDHMDAFATRVLEQGQRFAAFVKNVEFGDKGGMMIMFFGAPLAQENNLYRALTCVLELAAQMREAALESVRWRMSITSGKAYTGLLGSVHRCEYTVLGSSVNLAARIVTTTPWGQVWVSERVHRLSQQAFQFEFLDFFTFKGLVRALPLYRLRGHKMVPFTVVSGPMVGRKPELTRIKELCRPLFQGESPGVIRICGDAGIGKSRLVHEFLEQVKSRVTVLFGHCEGIVRKPMNPYKDILIRHLDFREEESVELKSTLLKRHLTELRRKCGESLARANGPDRSDILRELDRAYVYLALLLDLPVHDELLTTLSGTRRRENIVFTFKNWLKAMALVQPCVVFLEDCHLLDPESLEALQSITHKLDQFPVLFLVTARRRDDGSLPALELEDISMNTIKLPPLDRPDVENFCNEGLKAPCSHALIDHLHSRSGGNPYYLQQLLLYLTEEHLLEIRGSEYSLIEHHLSLPDSINALLVARIDRLPASLKQAVKTAAVLGQEFKDIFLLTVLRQLDPEYPVLDFYDNLARAEALNIWSSRRESMYSFNNALLHDTAYHMQMSSQVRHIHSLAAEMIEALNPDDPVYYTELALHYHKAGEQIKAPLYLQKASLRAESQHHQVQSLEYLDLLLTYPLEETSRQQLVYQRARKMFFIGRREEAERIVRTELEMKGVVDQPSLTLKYLIFLAEIERNKGNYPQALEYYKKASEINEHTSVADKYDALDQNIGIVYLETGDYDQAMGCFQKDLEHAHQTGAWVRYAHALGNIGNVYASKSELDMAMSLYEQELVYEEEYHDLPGISSTIGNMGMIYKVKGDYTKAMECCQKKLDLSVTMGDGPGLAMAVGNMGVIYEEIGNFGKAMECYSRLVRVCEEIRDNRMLSIALANIGIIHRKTGDLEQALGHYEKAIALASSMNVKYYLCSFLYSKAEVLADLKQWSEARHVLEEAVGIAREIERRDVLDECKQLKQSFDSLAPIIGSE